MNKDLKRVYLSIIVVLFAFLSYIIFDDVKEIVFYFLLGILCFWIGWHYTKSHVEEP